MVNKFKLILETIPLAELEDMYTYIYGKCNYCRSEIEIHLLGYFHQYLHLHKSNEKIKLKCWIMLSWFNYMYEKYIKKENE